MASKEESAAIGHYRFCFKVLSLNGLSPVNVVRPLVVFNMSLTMLALLLCVVKTILELNIEQLEIMTLNLQLMVKQYSLVIYMNNIQDMLDDIRTFWHMNLPTTRLLSKYLKMQRFYMTWLIFSFSHIMIKPLVIGGSGMGCYYPEQIPFFITYIFECYVCSMAVIIFIGLNLLCCLMIVMTGEQFYLLNCKLRSLDLSQVQTADDLVEYRSILKEYIIYHTFLLKFIKKLNGILSRPLFFTMGISIAALCFSMYNTQSRMNTLLLKFRVAFIGIYVITEYLLFYGHPTQVIMDEAKEVGDSLYYYTEWYLPKILPLRKHINLMQLRSQKPTLISAEGLFLINNTTAVLLLKTAYTFFAFLQTVQKSPEVN